MAAGHRRILEAARPLFCESGFAAVSIEQIALAAGVAVPTIYAAFGSKRGVLLALIDERVAPEAGPMADGGPEEQLRGPLRRPCRASREKAICSRHAARRVTRNS